MESIDVFAPLASLQWVDRNTIHANDYNPNKVSEENLKLLVQSILTNGWTLPIVVRPDGTMAKAAAPATATANTPAAPAAQSNEGGYTTMATTIEELRKENPELCRQLEQSASEQASQNERTRLSEIDEVANLFDPTMVQEAKYGKTACDARELAFRAAKAAAAQGHEFLKNLAADNQASGAQGVEAVPGASATGDPESLPDAKGNVPKTQAERMAAAEAAVDDLFGDNKK